MERKENEMFNIIFNPPLTITFKGKPKILGVGFTTLDEEKEITAPSYTKFVHTIDELSSAELKYIIVSYVKMRELNSKIKNLIASLSYT